MNNPFLKMLKDQQSGSLYHQPVILGLEHGIMFSNFYWSKDGSQFLYNLNHMTPLSVIVGLTKATPDLLILELIDG